MKFFSFFLTAVFFCCLSTADFAQVTNLVVNDSTQHFVMTSGDTISWSYNIPTGDTALAEIWYDLNHNGKIDSSTDVLFQSFMQVDGNTQGNNGPPDMDGQVNGKVTMQMPVGVAPGNYIFRFSNKNIGESVEGTVKPLKNPAYTITGKIIVPPGKSAANIFVELNRDGQYMPNFWDAVTDSNGNYTIEMNSDTAGNPWRLDFINYSFPSAVISPKSYSLTIKGDTSNLDFSVSLPAAEIDGKLMTENGQAIPNWYVGLHSLENNFYLSSNTDINGNYHIGLPDSVLGGNYAWQLQTGMGNSDTTGNTLEAVYTIPSIKNSDVIKKNLVIYTADALIKGKVTIDGHNPGYAFKIFALAQDTAQAVEWTDSTNGNFILPVSSKIYNYSISVDQSGQNYYVDSIIAHPGDDNVIVNLRTSIGTMPAAEVDGKLKTENGQAIPNGYVGLHCLGNNFDISSNTDINGNYHISLPDSAIAGNYAWQLDSGTSNTDTTGNTLEAVYFIPSIKDSDVIYKDLVIYTADTLIEGRVTIDGHNPGYAFKIYAFAQDTAQAAEWTDSTNGNFILPVSSKIYNYSIDVDQSGQNYYVDNIIAHPGDDSVIVNLSTSPTEAKQFPNSIPKKFALDQNYPNPFNPTTTIKYSIPQSGLVKLVVYNILGEEVKTLVNQEQPAGSYNINFNADNLSSGIYFYKINAGNYSAVKKMILLK